MPNKPRPDCPRCIAQEITATAMARMHILRPRGETTKPAGDTFYCDEHRIVAIGREGTLFVDEGRRELTPTELIDDEGDVP